MQCKNGVLDSGETGVDCGGICAVGRKCADFSACAANTDCTNGLCFSNVCLRRLTLIINILDHIDDLLANHCGDGSKDGDETSTDCGGSCAIAKKCSDGMTCNISGDCNSAACLMHTCLRKYLSILIYVQCKYFFISINMR